MLSQVASQALADLVPLLACGEEAAALTFHRLGRRSGFDAAAVATLATIEAEELRHEAYLTAVARRLPPPRGAEQTRRAARRFQLFLAARDPVEHLARIAAIDAGVCLALARLLRPEQPLTRDRVVAHLFRRIHCDEARHVAAARSIAMRHANQRALRDSAAEARVALARLMETAGDAFDALDVDPVALVRDLARLPDGLI